MLASYSDLTLSPAENCTEVDPGLRVHRHRLAKIVRGVVIASVLVCVAALGRAAIGSVQSAEAEVIAPRIGAVLRDAPAAVATIQAHLDSLSKRTHDAIRAEERRASKGAHGSSRRFEW